MKQKIYDFTAILIIQLILTLPFYTASVYGLTISNVKVAKVSANSATIEWATDIISSGKVKYGKTTALGFTERHDNFIGNHSSTLFNGIDSDSTYLFAIESTDLAGNTAIDNNSNSFYTFRTTDITPPLQVTGLKAASTTPSSISLAWNSANINDLSHYLIYRNRIAFANSSSNRFNDTGLEAGKDYNYKVSAVDISGNEGQQSDTLIVSTLAVDSVFPLISSLDVLPVTDTTARISWITNENATTIVFYGANKTDKIKSSGEFETNHTIFIDGLAKNSQISFIARSCDPSNNCANSSIQKFIAGKDTTLPFISAAIPRFVNRRVLDIAGSTEPFSSVTLFVNSMNIPKRSLGNNEVPGGKFVFSQIQLEKDNIIKLVAVDKSGNKNQKIFETSIDTEDPVVQLNEILPITSRNNITISGFVNEQATIRAFAETDADDGSIPSKITGLNLTKLGQNSVEFRWDESKDKGFSHYVVHREDSSPIAITKPANFNIYIDALVDSGKTYTYQISAVNLNGREGPKSEPLTVTTLRGGAVLNLKPAEVDIFEDFRKPQLAMNATGSFSFGVRLNKGDAAYKIKLIFEDRAGNSVIFERNLVLDTKKPEVKITSPPSGASLFENVANEIDIVGKTKPNARVHLFVDRNPLTFFNASFEISGLPNEAMLPSALINIPQDQLDRIPEPKLDAKCRSSVSSSFCRTGADFSVDADANGEFKFENVDLTVLFGGAARLTEVSPTDFRDTSLNQEADSKRVTLVVIATDATGQRGVATQPVRIVTCWSGNQSWDIIPLTQYQSPTFLSTERLSDGTETLYFYLNYTYMGRGSNAKISRITLSKACGTKDLLDPRFNISCQILPSGDRPTKLGSSNTISYSSITLGRFPGMDRFLENDWKDWLKGLNKEMTFPFKVRVQYEHDVIGDEGKSSRIRETQTLCEQVTYVVDDSIIDPRKILPDWLLFDFVDFLQESVATITELQQKVDTLINYVAIGCLGSIFANNVVKIWRNWQELWDEKLFKAKKLVDVQFNLGTEQKNTECKELALAVEKAYGSLKLKYLSDADLEKCFPNSASAWKSEEKIYASQRWTCDRIFGHSSPSGWTKDVGDDELHREITSEKTCNSDLSVRGQKIRVENCKDIAGKFIDLIQAQKDIPFDKKCFLVNLDPKNAQKQFIYTFADVQDSALNANKIYTLTSFERNFLPGKKDIYVLKTPSDNFYMTSQPQTCAELCGMKSQPQNTGIQVAGSDGVIEETVYDKDKKEFVPVAEFERRQAAKNPTAQEQVTKTDIKIASCATVNDCREWNARGGSKSEGILYKGRQIKDYRVESKGYASNCFYGATEGGPEIVSDTDPNTRKECCCVNGQASPFKTVYYQPGDVDTKLPAQFQKPVHKSNKAPEVPVVGQTLQEAVPPPAVYGDMEWSYRYSKIGFLSKKYNPNRYISGRDQPACLGQDHPFALIANKPREVVMLEPARQDAVVLWPCFFLTGVNQRLQRIKVISSAMSNCLIQVRTTGRADAGVCKELFTQHLCDTVWQGIRFFVDGCNPEYTGTGKGDPAYLEDAQLVLKGVFQGISEAQSEIASEYSNAKVNDLIGAGEESVARKLCLAAFGYDWEINARNLIDAAYSTPFATLVQAVTRSREFLTVDPVTKKPKYEYRASWIINPGCELERYDVQLACVTRKELDKYPNNINCGSIGSGSIAYTGKAGETSRGYSQCDCLELPQEQIEPFYSASRIKQNALEDKNLAKPIESARRFDHIKITLRPDRKIAAAARTNCFPTGYEEGIFYFPIIDKTAHDILDCTADASSGLFTCGSGTDFFSRKGIAEVLEVRINNEQAEKFTQAEAGDTIKVTLKVRKTGIDKCARLSVTDLSPQYEFIRENTTTEVNFVTQPLAIAGKEGDSVPIGIPIKVLLRNNNENKDVNIRVQFQAKAPELNRLADDTSFSLSDENDKILVEGISNELVSTTEFNRLLESKGTPGEIIVDKEGVRIKIENPSLNPPRIAGQPYSNGGIITIKQQSQIAQLQGTQRKTITVELFHTKEDNPDECNLGEVIYSKPYNFVIGAKATQSKAPAIDVSWVSSNKDSRIVRKGDLVTINAKVVDAFGVKNVDAVLTAPDGSNVDVQKNEPRGDNYIFVFDTGSKAPMAGIYRGVIKAKSKQADREEGGPRPFQFEVQCGGESNVYGRCQDSCPFDKLISTPLQCKSELAEDGVAVQPCCRI
ncbi:fibronectin type III domain-containing protein [Candidatus Woesearchaeota archaeon]|nr:fibronectin type III domain-containing protein [Candidatus Woesearchaeota archaeon]